MRLLRRVRRIARQIWALFQESRLGLAGLIIVLAFGALAVLAPIISPFPRDFEAPESDRFGVSQYERLLLPNLTYNPPVLGPTTPLSSDRQGGLWLINSARQGFVFMDFVRDVLETDLTPFQAGNRSLRFDITQDFGIPISLPLTAVYYLVPGRNTSGQAGPGIENGALAFFANRDFVVVDPFTKSVIYRSTLDFSPTWTGVDPASIGDMLVQPLERTASIGIVTRDVGPYRYFYAADANRLVVFEVSYVHSLDLSPTGGRIALDLNATLSGAPFVYYNQGQVDAVDVFRGGPGQGIFVPLANHTLAVYNVSGKFRAMVPLLLNGEPATVTGSIGFTRAEFPPWLYLPLRSDSAIGLAIFDVPSLSIRHSLAMPNPAWEPVGVPTSYRGKAVYAGLFDPQADTTRLVRINETAAETLVFRQEFSGRLRTYFETEERSKVFVVTDEPRIVMITTVFSGERAVPPEPFAILPPKSAQWFAYAGAFGGTLFGTGLTQQELNGVWLEPAEGRVVAFQLLGTVRTPLPPGEYPSGNRYILGTDFRGGDILTQLFWGTQVAFIVGVLAAAFAVGLGTFMGLISGYYGKVVDTLLMRTTDIFLVLPFLPIVLILAAILRPSIWVIILVLGIVGWPGIARIIRAQTLTLKERPFIDAARVTGASDFRIIFYHIAPNVLPFSFLFMTLGVAGAIVTEAFLSFLGLGDSTVISWGGMLSQVLTFGGALTAWWWLLPPGLAITFVSLGFYLLGRGFDKIINPRLRRR